MKTGSWKCFDGEGRVSISRSQRGVKGGYRCYRALAPGSWFHSVDKAEYERLFFAQLFELDARKVWEELHKLAGDAEPVLMCHEVPPFTDENFCHRRMVATWLEQELGVDIAELPPTKLPPGTKVRASSAPAPGKRNAASKRKIAYPAQAAFPFLDGSTVPDGEKRSVAGSRGNFYTVCNHGGTLYCDCPSFIFCPAPKSCKHLIGVDAEQPPAAAV